MASEISEHVTLTITEDSVGITRAGFGTPLILSANAGFAERIRYYTDLPGLVTDGFVSTSPEYLAAQAMLSQNPRPERYAVGRAVGKPTQAYRLDVTTVAAGNVYKVTAKGQGVTATDVSYTALADLTFVDGDITVGTDTIAEAAHGMVAGAGPFRVSNSGGALPAGLAVDTNYWIIAPTADTYKLASSKANALAGTAVDITAAAGGGTHTLRRAQNDVIAAQLVQGLNAVVGKNFTAAQVVGAGETDYLTVTGDAAGNWFSLEVANVAMLKVAQTHAEPGTTLATDLAAIELENSDWYGLVTLYNSDAYVKAAAAWAESNTKIYIADVSDSETATLATGGGDLADDLKTLAYARTAVAYHPSPANMMGAAWLGRVLPTEPGAATWKFKTLSGVAAVTSTATHRVNLRAKNANTYQTIGGKNMTWEGTTADGDFIDITRNQDWLYDDMQKGVFGVMQGADIIPLTDPGIAMVQNEVEASLDRAVTMGILSNSPAPVVTVPKATAVSVSNRALRKLPDVKWSATMAGAIHKVTITGVVSV